MFASLKKEWKETAKMQEFLVLQTSFIYTRRKSLNRPPLSPHAPGERWELGIKSQRFIRVQTCVLYKNKCQVLLSARFISGYSKRGKHTNYRNKKIVTVGHTFFIFAYFISSSKWWWNLRQSYNASAVRRIELPIHAYEIKLPEHKVFTSRRIPPL